MSASVLVGMNSPSKSRASKTNDEVPKEGGGTKGIKHEKKMRGKTSFGFCLAFFFAVFVCLFSVFVFFWVVNKENGISQLENASKQ